MKSKILVFLVLSIVSVAVASGQTGSKKLSPVGTWKYEAPNSDPGFDSGIAELSFADGKYSGTVVFTGTEYKFPASSVKFANDTLFININVNNADIKATLKFIDDSKMVGTAVSSEAEFQVILTRIVPPGAK
jgi:hypothetical protein